LPLPINLPPPPVAQPIAPEPPVEPIIPGPPGPDDCGNHPGIRATVLCSRCGRKNCAKCVKQQKIGMKIVDFCQACGGQCKKLSEVAKEAAKAAAIPTTF